MENEKKILNVVSVFFSIPFFFGDQLKYFREKGYDIYLVCSPSDKIENFANIQNVKFKEFKIVRKFTIFQDLKTTYKLYQYIKKNKFDIVVGHTPKGALLSMLASFFASTQKRVYFRHGLVYETKKGIGKYFLKNIERLTSLLSTKVVCVSPYLIDKSIADKLTSIKKLTLLRKGSCNGVDVLSKFNPSNILETKLNNLKFKLLINEENYVIGYVGRLVKDKGISELVQAFLSLLSNHKKVKLLLVGPYEDKDALDSNTINEIERNENIIRVGHIDDEIEYYYALMNIFILPTYREGLGTSILEASSMEIPVLTTSHTGSRDAIINNVTGSYIDVNSKSIFNTLDKYIKNQKEYCHQGYEGRKHMLNNFKQELIWKEIECKIYN